MCRTCGRMIRCIFDTMPSKIPSGTRSFVTATRGRRIQYNRQHDNSSQLLRSTLNVEAKSAVSPPTFLLPFRARLHQATSTQAAIQSSSPPAAEIPPSMLQTSQPKLVSQASAPSEVSHSHASHIKPLVLSKSVQQLLPLLSAQKPHYITTHVHRFPYLVTAGDTLRLPFHMHGVNSGDIIRMNRASILGSRDYTLKAGTSSTELYDKKRTGEPNYIDERMFEVRARVLAVDSTPMFMKEKTKRRNRKVKTARSKHRFTVLKIMEVKVKTLEELKADKGLLLLESCTKELLYKN